MMKRSDDKGSELSIDKLRYGFRPLKPIYHFSCLKIGIWRDHYKTM